MTRLTAAPRRALLLTACVAVLCLCATACNGVTPPAATVAGHTISDKQLFADLAALTSASNKAKMDPGGGGTLSTPTAGSVTDSYSSVQAAQALNRRVVDLTYQLALAKAGIKVTSANKSSANNQLCVDASTGQPTTDGSCPSLANYPAAYRSFLLADAARAAALQDLILKRAYPEVKASDPAALAAVCFGAVQVSSAAIATTLEKDIRSGMSMAAAATKVGSSDASAPGSGCEFISDLPNLKSRPLGYLDVASDSSGGTYVLQVTGYDLGTEQAFVASPPTTVPKVAKMLQAASLAVSTQFRISVDPQFGVWNTTTGSVDPPPGPSAPRAKPKHAAKK